MATIKITGFEVGAAEYGGNVYLLDIDGAARRYEQYANNHTAWTTLVDTDTEEEVETAGEMVDAIDEIVAAFDAAYDKHWESINAAIEAATTAALLETSPVDFEPESEDA